MMRKSVTFFTNSSPSRQKKVKARWLFVMILTPLFLFQAAYAEGITTAAPLNNEGNPADLSNANSANNTTEPLPPPQSTQRAAGSTLPSNDSSSPDSSKVPQSSEPSNSPIQGQNGLTKEEEIGWNGGLKMSDLQAFQDLIAPDKNPPNASNPKQPAKQAEEKFLGANQDSRQQAQSSAQPGQSPAPPVSRAKTAASAFFAPLTSVWGPNNASPSVYPSNPLSPQTAKTLNLLAAASILAGILFIGKNPKARLLVSPESPRQNGSDSFLIKRMDNRPRRSKNFF